KSSEENLHESRLSDVFKREYDRKGKCSFGVKAGKFFGFYLTEKGIKANLDKCEAIIKMEKPTTKERIMKLNEMLTTLNKFISCSAQHAMPFYRLLQKE
ncbi:hypothetical protein A2U01_0056791, partial [Trifolium medium]|nr:hypothetical protein [Trifolium medium]